MKSRLDDLIATGDRQLASKSWDAAIDTFRTALSEPGAGEAGVDARLDAACRARDAARGIVPRPDPPPSPAAVTVAPLAVAEAAPPEVVPDPPKPSSDWAFRTIEPPSFKLVEDEPNMFETPRQSFEAEPERLSILDPVPPQHEEPDQIRLTRLALTAAIVVIVVVIIIFASYK